MAEDEAKDLVLLEIYKLTEILHETASLTKLEENLGGHIPYENLNNTLKSLVKDGIIKSGPRREGKKWIHECYNLDKNLAEHMRHEIRECEKC